MKGKRFLIITGLSGSGKTAASRFLEDLGYYCVDNLPAKLIPSFVDLWRRKEVEIGRVALIVDIREAGFATEFPRVLSGIREKVSSRLIFLEASNETLIKRFSESRRPHPLTEKKSILENVILERKRLEGIKALADEIIDTTALNITEFKKILMQRFQKGRSVRLRIVVVSFGYKYGIPLDSDLVLDTRFLPNPYYVDELREKTGLDADVQKYIFDSDDTRRFLKEMFRFVDFLIPRFVEEGKSYLTISIGCTGGKHRSVMVAEKLEAHLTTKKYITRIYHRDMYK